MENYYAILGLDPGASRQSIKIAYRRLAREAHPDKQTHSSESEQLRSVQQMAQLNEAYATLCDAQRRREYDDKLRIQGILATKQVTATHETKPISVPSRAAQRIRIRPNPEVDSSIVKEYSKQLRTALSTKRSDFSWKGRELEGFDWAFEGSSWFSHFWVALRSFSIVNAAAAKKFINYSEVVIAHHKTHLRKSHFLFLLPFEQLSEWESVSEQCRRFVTAQGRADSSRTPSGIVLLDLQHSRSLRFDAQLRGKACEHLLQSINAVI